MGRQAQATWSTSRQGAGNIQVRTQQHVMAPRFTAALDLADRVLRVVEVALAAVAGIILSGTMALVTADALDRKSKPLNSRLSCASRCPTYCSNNKKQESKY